MTRAVGITPTTPLNTASLLLKTDQKVKWKMARRPAEEMSGPLSLVYIAGNVPDAEAAERILTEKGIEYVLTLEPFTTTSYLMNREHMGLFVYVPSVQHRFCRELLESQGLTETVELEGAKDQEKQDGA